MILLCLNGIIGAGLFLLPGKLDALAGKWGVLIYLLVATIVISIAWCFAQCATRYQKNGGAYLYAKEAFGPFIGFEIGLMRLFSGMVAWATLAVGFLTALGTLFPEVLMAPVKHCLIVGLIGGLGIINLFGIRMIQGLNNIITAAKLLPLCALICVGFFFITPSHLVDFGALSLTAKTVGSSALLIFYAFSGFEALPIAAAEMKDPQKNIPRAIMVAIALCSLLYFLVHLLCIGLLGPELAESNAPLADAANTLFGNRAKYLVTLAMLISIGGVTVVSSFTTPRSCVALAQDRMIPQQLVKNNSFGSPYLAILLSVTLTCAIAFSGNFVQLVTISVVSRFAQYVTTCLALYVFDRKGIMKPFNRPWKRVIPLFALLGIGWLLLQTELYQLCWGCGALILGIPLYFLQRKSLGHQKDVVL